MRLIAIIAVSILCVYCFFLSVEILNFEGGYPTKWYSGYLAFARWNNVSIRCDYVTNVPVYRWYSKQKEVKSYRPNNFEQFKHDLVLGDTLHVGIDYYALNICSNIVPPQVKKDYAAVLSKGSVLVFDVWLDTQAGMMYWKVLDNK